MQLAPVNIPVAVHIKKKELIFEQSITTLMTVTTCESKWKHWERGSHPPDVEI